nr:hypothetical protein [Tanacetum cinerariifolium]
MAEVAGLSDSAFRKRLRSSYESSPSSSPPDLPSQKHYQGTSELVKDDEEEGDDEEEDKEMEESSDSNSVSEDAEDAVFVDIEISTQADRAPSSRVLVPLPKDPFEAIRHAYLVRTDTESEPFEDPIETKAPESPRTVAPPTSLPDSTPPPLVPILCDSENALRLSLFGRWRRMAEVAGLSDSAFRKRLRSSYESSPSSSPPDLPSQKHYQGTSELVKDDEEEGDDEEEDKEMEESSDSNSVS